MDKTEVKKTDLWFPVYLSDGRLIKKEADLKPKERRYAANRSK